MNKTLIIVPAYNEAGNIERSVADIREHKKDCDILVINDCSTDNTSEVAGETKNCKVVDLPVNLGIGGAVQTGFKYASENGYEYCVQFDGDGQHNAAEIDKILDPVMKGEADVFIGSRFLKKEPNFRSTFARRKGIFIFKIVNLILTGQKITDNTSGFRAYNKRATEFLSHNYPEDFPEPESVVLLGRNGFRIKEVSVNMKERQNGSSSIYGLRIPYYMFKVLLSVIMTSLRKRKIYA